MAENDVVVCCLPQAMVDVDGRGDGGEGRFFVSTVSGQLSTRFTVCSLPCCQGLSLSPLSRHHRDGV